MKNKTVRLISFIFLCELVGIVGATATTPAIPGWYASLQKPSFSPPNWIFGPVWTTLYAMMGASLFLVWEKSNNKKALVFFFSQLSLNLLWSLVFFGLKNPLLALINIVFLWVLIILTIFEFRKLSKPAAILLIPYLVWVTFASFLNLNIVLLN